MKSINFIPVSFHRIQAGRKAMVRCSALLVAVLAALTACLVYEKHTLDELNRKLVALQSEAAAIVSQNSELDRLRSEQAELMEQSAIHRMLQMPVPMTSIIAAVDGLMPPSVGLISLSLHSPGAAPTQVAPVKGKSSARRQKKDDAAAEPAVLPITLELAGMAPTDVVIGRFMGQLSSHPLFDNIKLVYSRPVQEGDLLGREFRITLEVPLDRRFELPASEVTHAH